MLYGMLPTPAVIVSLDAMERNIQSMIAGATANGIAHRPHIKTHRSSELAKLQLRLGARGITCARLGEAEVMADSGINDILLAYPVVGEDKRSRYVALWKRCTLRSIVNSVTAAEALSNTAVSENVRFEVLIDLDSGVKRGGLAPGIPALEFAKQIAAFPGIQIVGLMYYPGKAYEQTTPEGIAAVARKERSDILETAQLLSGDGHEMRILSGGNTPSSKMPHCLRGLTELRAGNYIFNDNAQLKNGLVTEPDCALRVIATVIARPDAYSAIIDAGSKTLSSDILPNNGNRYGYIVNGEHMALHKLNEEHGFIGSDTPISLQIGERIEIIPNHACVVTNLANRVYGIRNGLVEREIIIDARGRSA